MEMEMRDPSFGKDSRWIFSNINRDMAFLFFPGLAIFFLNFLIKDIPHNSRLFAAYFFLDASFFGSGHIYITGLRTYLSPEERTRSTMYLWVPPLCFLIFFSWRYFGLSWLVFIPAYAQFWHYMRQSFGIQKWYQRRNQSYRRGSDYFTQFLCTLPFLIFHFRQATELNSLFLPKDLMLFPNEQIKNALLFVYFLGIFAWLIYEIRLLQYKEWNRSGYVLISAIMNGLCFCLGRNEVEIIFPLVAYHGIAYFALTTDALHKIRRKDFPINRAIIAVFATALVFGFYERMIEYKPGNTSLFLESVWAGIYITPILLHYIYDAFLWRAKHPESKYLYGSA